ncbi:LysR family transcriptional regulator [Phenylobacterium sp.]|uniref:LysR family transcriptional regulator n=1 Tax=Phenylobacterium sp. TaxID=1871053 RepID=UPI0035AFDCA5
MNVRAADLNLLAILDVLLDEAHVSRAAVRLGLSQSAASNALERARALFGDRLLERAAGGMRPTPFAEALRPRLRAAIADLEALLAPEPVDLATLRRTVRVVMADAPADLVALGLHRRLADTAPGLDLVIQPWRGAPEALDALGRGDADLAISVFPAIERDFRREVLLEERYVVAMRAGHPAAQSFDLDAWLRWPHVLVSGRGETTGPLDEALVTLGRSRRVAMVVPSFGLAVPLVAGSNLIAMLPARSIPPERRRELAVFDPPLPVAGFPLHLAWHRRSDGDVAVAHVAQTIREAFARP